MSGNLDMRRFDVMLTDNVPPKLIIDSLGFTDTIAYRENDIDLLIESVEKYRAHLGINDYDSIAAIAATIADSITWKSLKLWFQ